MVGREPWELEGAGGAGSKKACKNMESRKEKAKERERERRR